MATRNVNIHSIIMTHQLVCMPNNFIDVSAWSTLHLHFVPYTMHVLPFAGDMEGAMTECSRLQPECSLPSTTQVVPSPAAAAAAAVSHQNMRPPDLKPRSHDHKAGNSSEHRTLRLYGDSSSSRRTVDIDHTSSYSKEH